jgi:chromatin segregation and condensation protein Rec8/ScpA/Scc1 (kleisin family)
MVEDALTREPVVKEPVQVIHPHKFTVREKIDFLRDRLLADGRVSFRAVIDACTTRMEIIVSFMAVLELIKSRVLDAVQDAAFADIVLVPTNEAALDTEVTSEFD